MKKVLSSLVVASTLLLASGTAFAFHGGGVAHCDGCHSMHQGNGNDRFAVQGAPLTNGSDPSSTCLNCHDGAARYHVNSDDGSNMNEGGDFHWVNDNGYVWVQRGNPVYVDGDNFGHNVVAADFGMAKDKTLTAAPGGTFPAADFGCHSCHDPHGQVNGGTSAGTAPISVSGSYGAVPATGTIAGNYRILFDSAKVGFSEDAPIARSDSYDGHSTQYGVGMSGWCANCHTSFYTQSSSGGMHPTDIAPPATYNSYVATGDFTGTSTTAYDPLVPIERGGVTASSELPDPTDAVTAGVGTNGTTKVMCLSCHRAHASPFENALRWDYNTSEFIAESWQTQSGSYDETIQGDDPATLDVVETEYTVTSSTVLPGATAAEYYKHGVEIDPALASGSPFTGGYGEFQRSLCNKCHAKD